MLKQSPKKLKPKFESMGLNTDLINNQVCYTKLRYGLHWPTSTIRIVLRIFELCVSFKSFQMFHSSVSFIQLLIHNNRVLKKKKFSSWIIEYNEGTKWPPFYHLTKDK